MTAAASTLPAFDPRDPLALDALLDDEERLIRDTVRQYVREKFLPHVAEHFEAGTFPEHVAGELGRLGLLGHAPARLRLRRRVGHGVRADLPGARGGRLGPALVLLGAGLAGDVRHPPLGQRGAEGAWLPGMAAGELTGCFGLTEPDAGSNPGAMRTRAKRDGDDWVLNGAKMWITNGSRRRRRGRVGAHRGRRDQRLRRASAARRGSARRRCTSKLSLRASVTSELVLDGVRVPEERRLPEATPARAAVLPERARYGVRLGRGGAAPQTIP